MSCPASPLTTNYPHHSPTKFNMNPFKKLPVFTNAELLNFQQEIQQSSPSFLYRLVIPQYVDKFKRDFGKRIAETNADMEALNQKYYKKLLVVEVEGQPGVWKGEYEKHVVGVSPQGLITVEVLNEGLTIDGLIKEYNEVLTRTDYKTNLVTPSGAQANGLSAVK